MLFVKLLPNAIAITVTSSLCNSEWAVCLSLYILHVLEYYYRGPKTHCFFLFGVRGHQDKISKDKII